uniref:Uncharacterized protein n=1 Tax=Zea mays TaxID=4577 RepID=B4FDT3_MAIZE|nr:unknown [Zea mays]ACR37126.1 unknown [Zea mays]
MHDIGQKLPLCTRSRQLYNTTLCNL